VESPIDVKQIESLEDLGNDLSRFRIKWNEFLPQIHGKLLRIREQLMVRLQLIQRLPDYRIPMDRPAGFFPGLGLGEYSRESELIQKGLFEVDKQIHVYRKASTRMKKLLEFDFIKAELMLKKKIVDLNKYIGVSLTNSGNFLTDENSVDNVSFTATDHAEPDAPRYDLMCIPQAPQGASDLNKPKRQRNDKNGNP